MLLSPINTCEQVSEQTLNTLVVIACKALEIASANNEDGDLLARPKNVNELETHNENISSIITTKLKNKFGM